MNWFVKFILWTLSFLYGLAIFIWDLFWKVAEELKLDCKVISVGNIVVGGTGKTPIVRYISQLASDSGYKTAVIARGYKRKNAGLVKVDDNSKWHEVGDEPMEVYRLTKNVRVYVHQSKTTAAIRAFADGAKVIVVDDGFQHRNLSRDVNIVCLDWHKPFGPGDLLPLGRLREPRKNLKRADILLYTSYDEKINCSDEIELDRPSYYVKSFVTHFENIKTGDKVEVNKLLNLKALVFCGLANPERFENDLLKLGINVVEFLKLGDHANYNQGTIDSLVSKARDVGANCLITTYKDAVKIETLDFAGIDIYSAMLEISIVDQNGADCKDELKQALGL